MTNPFRIHAPAADPPPTGAQPGVHPAPAGPSALLLSAERVAGLLGVGKRTVWTWDAAGKLPEPVRIGATVRWRAAELDEWTAAGCPDRATWAALRAARK